MRSGGPGSLVTDAREPLLAQTRAASADILLVSPFLSAPVARELAAAADASLACSRRLLTSLSSAATAAGVLSREGLLTLLAAGFELRSARNLHAKVMLVDGAWGIVGSGNLTLSGLGGDPRLGNAELGVRLTPAQADEATALVESWWRRALPLDAATVERFPSPIPRRGGAGEAIGPALGDPLAAELTTDRARGESTGRWLKMMYDTPERADEWWRRVKILEDEHRRRPDGAIYHRPAYELHDLVALYVVGEACPAIFEVTRPAEYEPERARQDPLALPDDWRRWGHVTEVACVRAVSLEEAPTLDAIGVAPSSVRRHGHLRLTLEQFRAAREAIVGR